MTGGWNEVTILKHPNLAKNTPKKATVEDNLWGCQQDRTSDSSHRRHHQCIQTTQRMEMGVKEISGKT